MSSKIITDGTEILTQEQADELWELGNSGAQNAATALSSLIGVPVSISVQKIIMVKLENLQKYLDDSVASMVVFQVRGQVSGNGSIILHVPKKSILRLSSIMLAAPDEDREISEMDMSMLHEIGNIMTSSYLDACANLLSLMLIPSPPSMVIDMPLAALQTIIANQEFEENLDQVVLFKTELQCSEHQIVANIILLPTRKLLGELFTRMDSLMTSSG